MAGLAVGLAEGQGVGVNVGLPGMVVGVLVGVATPVAHGVGVNVGVATTVEVASPATVVPSTVAAPCTAGTLVAPPAGFRTAVADTAGGFVAFGPAVPALGVAGLATAVLVAVRVGVLATPFTAGVGLLPAGGAPFSTAVGVLPAGSGAANACSSGSAERKGRTIIATRAAIIRELYSQVAPLISASTLQFTVPPGYRRRHPPRRSPGFPCFRMYAPGTGAYILSH